MICHYIDSSPEKEDTKHFEFEGDNYYDTFQDETGSSNTAEPHLCITILIWLFMIWYYIDIPVDDDSFAPGVTNLGEGKLIL